MVADLLVTNAEIWSFDEEQGIVEALAVRDGRIVAVGRAAERIKAKRVIDLDGRLVFPGIVDAHMHPMSLSLMSEWLDLRDVASIEELKERLRLWAEGRGGWIVGRGWDQESMVERRCPTRWDLDEVVPDRPVFLLRVCGHLAVLNTKAMEMTGLLGSGRPDVVVEDGRPTGLIIEDAVYEVYGMLPKPSIVKGTGLMISTLRRLARMGIRGICSMGAKEYELKVYKHIAKKGDVPIRVSVYLDQEFLSHMDGNALKGLPPKVDVAGVKLFADGSLGGRTAALSAPYSDAPNLNGRLLLDSKTVSRLVNRVESLGLRAAIHAIGDRAVYEVLKGLRRARMRNHRIEHASLINEEILEMFSELKPMIAVQPGFIVSDEWAVKRVGEGRARYLYAYKTMEKAGALIAFSSDAPVETPNPTFHLYAAVTRGRDVGVELSRHTGGEEMNFVEAMRRYTVYSSLIAGFQPSIIRPGYEASFVVFDARSVKEAGRNLKNLNIYMGVVNGQIN